MEDVAPAEAPEEELEEATCPLCTGEASYPTPYGDGRFAVRRCRACGVHFLSPRLTEDAIRRHYEAPSYFGAAAGAGYEDYRGQAAALRKSYRRLFQLLDERGLTGGSLLEVGCGPGYLLDEAAGRFKLRAGIEFSEAAEEASGRADEVYRGGVEVLPTDSRFDCIIAAHVIEHVYRPAQFLHQLIEHLSPKGSIVLITPDMNGFWRRVLGSRWPSFKYPEHVVLYGEQHLAGLMRSVGLDSVERLPLVEDFRVSDLLAKAGLAAPAWATHRSLPVPGVSICLAGRKPEW